MAKTSLRHRLLGVPATFDLYQRLIGAPESKRTFIVEYVRPRRNDRVLDLGCGTGALLSALPGSVSYVGVDIDPAYIAAAKRTFPGRGQFVCADLTRYRPSLSFDIVMAYGLLHHLDDQAARRVVRGASESLEPSGRALFAEPCRTSTQGRMERLLIECDRGRHIRSVADYVELVSVGFAEVAADIMPDTYRIPFTLVILRGKRGSEPIGDARCSASEGQPAT
jgi:SAM-dependent methyltransferase